MGQQAQVRYAPILSPLSPHYHNKGLGVNVQDQEIVCEIVGIFV